jgi:uncharacterized protein with HEPN domain
MRNDHERILDILEAIQRIEQVSSHGKDAFYHDELVQVWIIYHLQIIGEAVRSISTEFCASHTDIPWSDIIGMRNILVHQYFGIDKDAVWKVVEHDLPIMKTRFEQYTRQ